MNAADSKTSNFTIFTMEKPTELYLKDADAKQKHLQITQKSQTAQTHRRLTETQQRFLDIKTEAYAYFQLYVSTRELHWQATICCYNSKLVSNLI